MKDNSEVWMVAPKVTSSLFDKKFLPCAIEMCDIYLSEDEGETGTTRTAQERISNTLGHTDAAAGNQAERAFRGGNYNNVAPAAPAAELASTAASSRLDPPWLPLPRPFQQPLETSLRTALRTPRFDSSTQFESPFGLSGHATSAFDEAKPRAAGIKKPRDTLPRSDQTSTIRPFLEEIPFPDTPPEDLPVASVLVQSLDLFHESQGHRKRSFGSQDEEEEDFKDSDDDASEDDQKQRFRAYQEDQWSERFRELKEYKQQHGHTMVPHNYKGNLPLARWVKRQRNQYKQLKEEGTSSTMTEERIRALEGIGFVWDCQRIAWDEKLIELQEYKDAHQDCNVPTNYPENPKLAMWVKCQRRQYKLFLAGKQSSMTVERINQLEDLGFSWGLRSYKKMKRS